MFRRSAQFLMQCAVTAAALISLCGGTDLFAKPIRAVITSAEDELKTVDYLSKRPYLAKAMRVRSTKPRTEVATLLADTLRSAMTAVVRPALYAAPSSSPFARHLSAGALLS